MRGSWTVWTLSPSPTSMTERLPRRRQQLPGPMPMAAQTMPPYARLLGRRSHIPLLPLLLGLLALLHCAPQPAAAQPMGVQREAPPPACPSVNGKIPPCQHAGTTTFVPRSFAVSEGHDCHVHK